MSETEERLNASLTSYLFKNEVDFMKFQLELNNVRETFISLQNDLKNKSLNEAVAYAKLEKVAQEVQTMEEKGREYKKVTEFATNFKIEIQFDEKRILDQIKMGSSKVESVFDRNDMDCTQLLTESFSRCSYKDELFRQMSANSANDVVDCVNKVIEFPDLNQVSPPPESMSHVDVKTPKNDGKKQHKTLLNSHQPQRQGSAVTLPSSTNDLKQGRNTGEPRSINTSSRPSFIVMDKQTSLIEPHFPEITASRTKNSFFKQQDTKKEPSPLTMEKKNIAIYKSLSNLSKHSSPRLSNNEKSKNIIPLKALQTPSRQNTFQAANVSNMQIDATKMRKIIFTLINAKGKLGKINFKNNRFVCDPIMLLIEIFKNKNDTLLTIDFTGNTSDEPILLPEKTKNELRKLNIDLMV